MKGKWNSAIYEGVVRHRRLRPRSHEFEFPLFMMYLDLAELPHVLDGRLLWSARRPAVARFRRSDYLSPAAEPLEDSVRAEVEAHTGRRPRGRIGLLTHLRYFGYCFNPVSFYFCQGESGTESIVAQITNTPWKERHSYVLDGRAAEVSRNGVKRFRFEKTFHVSPFMAMEQSYDWSFTEPGESLLIHMNQSDGEGKLFDATLTMSRREISGAGLASVLLRYPLMTARVIARIYFEALRLRLKGVPVVPHPGRAKRNDSEVPAP